MDSQVPNHKKVAGIILAAGAASRMGQPKLLLPWKGSPLIHHAARTALEAGLDPVVVVTGAAAGDIEAALAGLNVVITPNPEWLSGQSTSVRAGILALPEDTDAAIFLLGDQPFVTSDLIRALVTAYSRTNPAILAPYVGDRRSNPVLFDRAVFDLLCQLRGDEGARGLFGRFPPAALPWADERISFDIDTPEDYQRLLEME